MSSILKILVICAVFVFVLLFYVKSIEVEAIPSDQRTVLIKSWALPAPSTQDSDFDLTSSYSGAEIYFVDSNANKIGRVIPQSNTVTQWDIPTANSLPTSVKFDSSGSVYFIESNANKIGRLHLETNKISEWSLPSNSSDSSAGNNSGIKDNSRQLSSLSLDPSTRSVYYLEGNSNTIGRLDPETNKITEWVLPSNSSDSGMGQLSSLGVDASTGNVYYVESNSNTIGRLDPETNKITEWSVQSNNTQIQSITLGWSENEIYFVDSNANKIGRLAPTTNLITEWDIPTANSLPTSVKFDVSTGSVYFIESNANSIGRLVLFYNKFTEWDLQEKPYAIEIDSSGNIHYIDDKGTKMVRMD